jgi:hypothetical protein
MANKTMAKKSKKKKSKAQPLCLQSTVEQMARKLLPNQYKKNNNNNNNNSNAAGVSLSVVEDQFRLLGTRIAVGRLLGGGNVVDTAERRAAVLLQQAYGIPWKSLAASIGVHEKDIKKLEQLQHVIRNHLLQPPTTTTTAAAAAAVTTRSRTRIQPAPAAVGTAQRKSSSSAASRSGKGGINNSNDDNDDIDDDETNTVNVGSSSTTADNYTTPQIIPSLVLRLSGYLGDKNVDDPHGAQQRATHLLQFIYQQYQLTTPVVTSSSSSSCADNDQQQQQQQQQRTAAHWYELRRYAAAYEVAAVMAVVAAGSGGGGVTGGKQKQKLSVEVAVTAAHGACTRREVQHVWPRVQQAWTDYCTTNNKTGPATRSGGGSRSTAGQRMATAMAKRQVQKMADQQQQPPQSTVRQSSRRRHNNNNNGMELPATKRAKRGDDGGDDDHDEAAGNIALLFAHSMAANDDDDDRDGLADGEADCDNSNMDAWKETVLSDAVQEHSSIELAARQVLAKFDLLTTFLEYPE